MKAYIWFSAVINLALLYDGRGGACKLFARTFPPLGTSLCPGYSLNYMCTVSDTSPSVTTVWTGTAFQQCRNVSQNIAGQIGLTQRTFAGFTPMTPGVCGNLTAVTTNVNVSCYTSVLTVTSPQYVNGTTIACLGVGNDTLNVLMACPPSPPTITPISCTSSSVTINWTKPFECGSPVAQYILTTNPPSQNCNTTCSQSPDLRQATISIQPNRTTTISVRADNCGGSQTGQTSSSSYLIQASGSMIYFSGMPVFDVLSQYAIAIRFSWSPLSMQLLPGGMGCGYLPTYTLTITGSPNVTQTFPVQCAPPTCSYQFTVEGEVAPWYNCSINDYSKGTQISSFNDVMNVSVNGDVVTCTFLPGLVGTSGCVVSFGTSPDHLPYISTSSQSGGSGQSISVQLTINGLPLLPSTVYYYEALLRSGHQEVVVRGYLTTAEQSTVTTRITLTSAIRPDTDTAIAIGVGVGGGVLSVMVVVGVVVIIIASKPCRWCDCFTGKPSANAAGTHIRVDIDLHVQLSNTETMPAHCDVAKMAETGTLYAAIDFPSKSGPTSRGKHSSSTQEGPSSVTYSSPVIYSNV